jgi:hypothetical protein
MQKQKKCSPDTEVEIKKVKKSKGVWSKSDGQSLKLLLRFEWNCVLMKEKMLVVSKEICRKFYH